LSQSTAAKTSGSTRYALGLLVVIYLVNHLDRQIMYILIEPVKADLGLSDSQMGLLVGAAFAIFYTFAGIPIARWADRGNRRNLIALALAIWSAFTIASGLARNFLQLMVARIGVGVGEAGCTPPAHSLISDYYPVERRSTALAIYQLGVPFGTLFGMAAGGFLADQIGWRQAFFFAGAPGILLAVVTRLTLPEPQRGASDVGADTRVEPLRDVLAFMWKLHALRHMMIGSSLQTLTLAALAAWHGSFFVRVHDMTLTQAGLVVGLIAGIAGGGAVIASGVLADRLGQSDPRWSFWLPAIGAIFSLPFSFFAYLVDSAWTAVALITCATIGNHFYSALGHAVAQSLVKPRMRAVMSAIALFLMNVIGFGIGPWLIGVISEALGGDTQLRYAMLVMIVGIAGAAVHYLLGARTYREDLRAKFSDEP